ncbi:helix-hairpin-helix domain-containing protein [Sphingobacterium sp.]|uniref:ComEA family DNA-binding protein n=1 Tax=Sphingobacterium sp. TaxID=341027 RepID=UPI0028B24024|nr:helix-hairpin-helix domain-containing protein [Sphingobacterium sp.]
MAQTKEKVDLQDLFESLSEELPEDADLSELTEKWHYYLEHPIDLNKTDGRELAELQFLNPLLIEQLLEHRTISGNFINLLELQSIDGFNERMVSLLLPFVRIGAESPLETLKVRNFKQEFTVRYARILEKAKGYRIADTMRSRYLGDANRYALRYRAQLNDRIHLAVNMEKDAGEPLFRDKQKMGFDFYSLSLSIKTVGHFKNIVIGDYALQFGQGLSMWNGLNFGKGGLVQNTARQGIGVRSYTSLNEANFMRGIAGTLQVNHIEITPYFSYQSIDGKVNRTVFPATISTIASTGLHRTPTEQGYRHAASQMTYGLNVLWRYRRLKVGVHFNQTKLDAFKTKGMGLRQEADFEGNLLRNISLYANYTIRNTYLFGEYANSMDGGSSSLAGSIISLHPRLSSVILLRDYKKNFHTFYGQGFGESDNTSNEQGAYLGLTYQLGRKLLWSNYADIFRFPGAKYQADTLSTGADFFSQLSYMWYKKGQLSLRYRNRLKQVNYMGKGQTENGLVNTGKQQLRVDFHYRLSSIWTIRSRVEANIFQKEYQENSFGYMFYQDVFWKSRVGKFRSNIRIAYFDAASYDNRIYAYEQDILYASGFGMYNTKGWRTYLNLQYRLSRHLEVWVKYALYYYPGREIVGTGLDQIEGNRKSEVKVQLRWQL